MGAAAKSMDDKGWQSWDGLKDFGMDAKVYVAKVELGGSGEKGQPVHDEQASEAERTYTTFQHLVGLVSMMDGLGILGLIGTLVMWRIKANDSPYYDDHGREAMNFQISLLVYMFGGAAILMLFTLITFGVGAIIAAPLAVLGVVFLVVIRLVGGIRGAMAANRGEYYRYPMCLRFLV
jgi:uncharacterized Tic20 family protein